MIFASLLFLFLFLPIVLICYYISPNQKAIYGKANIRNSILLIASFVFYSFGSIKNLLILTAYILVNYFAGILIKRNRKCRIFITLGIAIDISILAAYKYLDFGITVLNDIFMLQLNHVMIELPLGISFIAFQCISYIVDVYRKRVVASENIIDFALYVSFFPQLIAGPIVRYQNIEHQISRREFDIDAVSVGVKRFIAGFGKKVILANNLGVLSDLVFSETVNASSHALLFFWIGAFAYTLQIYYDFSGYSDMAIGLGSFFGFRYPENFNNPYISHTITEFWRRWHISLGEWFRDYVYIPLGGSRKKIGRNLLVVWFLTGLWHGAGYTFLLWGGINGVLVFTEKAMFKKASSLVGISILKKMYMVAVFLYINCQWVVFRVDNIGDLISFTGVETGFNFSAVTVAELICIAREYGAYFILAIIFAYIIPLWGGNHLLRCAVENVRLKTASVNNMSNMIEVFFYMFILLWSMSFLIVGTHNPFIYWSF